MKKPEGYLHPSLNDVDEFRESLRALMPEEERNSHFGVQIVQSFFSHWRYTLSTLDVTTREAWLHDIQTASPHTKNFLAFWMTRQEEQAFTLVSSSPHTGVEDGLFYLYCQEGALHYTFRLSERQRAYESSLPTEVVAGSFDECSEEIRLLSTYGSLPLMAVNQLLYRLKSKRMLPHYSSIMKEKWKKKFHYIRQYPDWFQPEMIHCFLQYLTSPELVPFKNGIDYEGFERQQKALASMLIFFNEPEDIPDCACLHGCSCTIEPTKKESRSNHE